MAIDNSSQQPKRKKLVKKMAIPAKIPALDQPT
jgi:hypothetical protein